MSVKGKDWMEVELIQVRFRNNLVYSICFKEIHKNLKKLLHGKIDSLWIAATLSKCSTMRTSRARSPLV